MDILSFAKSNIVFWLWMIMYIGIKKKCVDAIMIEDDSYGVYKRAIELD